MIYLIALLLGVTSFNCRSNAKISADAPVTADTLDVPSHIVMVAKTEPGDFMVISGTIYLADGTTPAEGAVLSVWQTDANGYYIDGGGGAGEAHPRLHGRMKTGVDGKYEFQTIKPAPYPNNTVPAHVHAHISAPSFPEYAVIYYFDEDQFITQINRGELNSHRGGTPSIIKLTRNAKGVLTGHRDFILEYVKPSSETMKLQW